MPEDPSLALVPLTDMGNTGVGGWGPQRNRILGLRLRFLVLLLLFGFPARSRGMQCPHRWCSGK